MLPSILSKKLKRKRSSSLLHHNSQTDLNTRDNLPSDYNSNKSYSDENINNVEYLDVNDKDDYEDEDEEDSEEMYDCSDSDSNSSDSSSKESFVSSVNPIRLRKNKIKHGHKVLITEDNLMSEALKDLQIQVYNKIGDVKTIENSFKQSQASETLLEIHSKYEINGLLISNELKEKLKEYDSNCDNLILNKFLKTKIVNENNLSNQNLQLMLWQPKLALNNKDENDYSTDENDSIKMESNSKNSSAEFISKHSMSDNAINNIDEQQNKQIATSYYTVEEPYDSSKSEKNKLKRKLSQLNKITIEEIKLNATNLNVKSNISNNNQMQFSNSQTYPSQPSPNVQFYLVDFNEQDDIDATTRQNSNQFSQDYPSTIKYNIREIVTDDQMNIIDKSLNKVDRDSIENMEIF